MEPVASFSKESWYYRLAQRGMPYYERNWRKRYNICEFVGLMAIGAIYMFFSGFAKLVSVVAAAIATIAICFLVYNLTAFILWDLVTPLEFARKFYDKVLAEGTLLFSIFMMIIFFPIIWRRKLEYMLSFVFTKTSKLFQGSKRKKKPGFISTAWKSFKEKTCVIIEFK